MNKRKRIWIILAGVMCVQLFRIPFIQSCPVQVEASAPEDEPKELYARSAVLMDADSGRVLFGKEGETVRPMASTTKIMTCILTLERMEEKQTAKASDHAVCQPKVKLGVKGKEEFYIKDLLYSLMLESHNDSAVVIAEGMAGSVEEFAALMNEKAEEIGCTDTHFVTPNGLDAEDEEGVHSTTAEDLARIMKYCITESPKKEEFLEITRTKEYSFKDVTGSRTFSCHNHNAFLDMMEGALSGKTGFTADAGYCYVGALKRGERTFIVALLACGWPNNKNYKWKDTKKLMEYALENYEYQDVWEETGQTQIQVKNGVDEGNVWQKNTVVNAKVQAGQKEGLQVLLGSGEKVEVKKKIKKSVKAPVKKGEKLGEITYILNGEVIKKYPVTALEEIEKRDMSWCFQTAAKRICL